MSLFPDYSMELFTDDFGIGLPDNFGAESNTDIFDDVLASAFDRSEAQSCADVSQDDPPVSNPASVLLNLPLSKSKPAICDESGCHLNLPAMTAELRGMFYVEEDVSRLDDGQYPPQLTCHRRTLWGCSGRLVLPRSRAYYLDKSNQCHPIRRFSASLSAEESFKGQPVQITTAVPSKGSPPSEYPLDTNAGQDMGYGNCLLHFSWDKVQFKQSTANNGRRNGLQQHYVLKVTLLAELSNGDLVEVAEVQFRPLVVRGRSLKTSNGKAVSEPTRGSTSVVSSKPLACQPKRSRPKSLEDHGVSMAEPQDQVNELPLEDSPPAKRRAVSPRWFSARDYSHSHERPNMSSADFESANGGSPSKSTWLPFPNSVSKNDDSPYKRSIDSQSTANINTATPNSWETSSQGPLESNEKLYQFFPLSARDLLPPVEAGYQPHAVHLNDMRHEVLARKVWRQLRGSYSTEDYEYWSNTMPL